MSLSLTTWTLLPYLKLSIYFVGKWDTCQNLIKLNSLFENHFQFLHQIGFGLSPRITANIVLERRCEICDVMWCRVVYSERQRNDLQSTLTYSFSVYPATLYLSDCVGERFHLTRFRYYSSNKCQLSIFQLLPKSLLPRPELRQSENIHASTWIRHLPILND